MKIRRAPLICGSVLLFSLFAPACESDNGTGTGPDGVVSPTKDAAADAAADAVTIDATGDAGLQPAVLGQPCEASGDLACDAGGDVLVCSKAGQAEGAWKAFDNGSEMNCSCSSDGRPVCSVPGFIGLERAGRARRAPSLRARRLAAASATALAA
jgi:hypothetical protein